MTNREKAAFQHLRDKLIDVKARLMLIEAIAKDKERMENPEFKQMILEFAQQGLKVIRNEVYKENLVITKKDCE